MPALSIPLSAGRPKRPPCDRPNPPIDTLPKG
ncbi:hypothetical protein EKPJFOCH_3406 [Methylobacterium thuringiense]|uniref:Uncharacterized protein n=1 Tax=Methylobacterium thuringiense TaxID=1003091 RepID=A0ABQ4TNN0_9HYPH|nr:hypothetical protein EKPJFOCH_3406 [Methylobacterium thuringiense]